MLKQNCKILLTGGTSGIGKALFKQLYALKHSMIVVVRNESKLEKLKTEYPGITTYQVDLTSRMNTLHDILEVTTKPVIYDGDTGGLVEHFGFTVRTLERLGVVDMPDLD